MNVINQIKRFAIGVVALVSLPVPAMSPIPQAPVLARVTTASGYMSLPTGRAVAVNHDFVVKADGKVHVEITYAKGIKRFTKRIQPLVYGAADIDRLQKSIAQLNPNRPLVEDPDSGVLCDGGSSQYSVLIDGVETVLLEQNGCRPNRYRQGRSTLEVAVIKVLEDLVSSYHNSTKD